MVGYSGTPLPRKLGARAEARALLLGAPGAVRAELRAAGLRPGRPAGELDFAMIFAMRPEVLTAGLARVERRLAADGLVWLCWPKKSSGVRSELGEADTRRIGLAAGLVDVKVCAVTEIWSGLKFVRRAKDRA